MRKLLLSMLAVAVLLGTAVCTPAQAEMKPFLTVSFAGYDKLATSLGVFGRLGGNPNVEKFLEQIVQGSTQGRGLIGLDKTQPWCVVMLGDGQQTSTYGFIPVTDLKLLVETAQKSSPLGQGIKLNNDVYEIQGPGQTVYAQQKGKWAVISDKKEQLSAAPTDPLGLLGDLPKNYNLAVRLSAKNAPAGYRDQALGMLKTGFEMGMTQQANEADEEFALRVHAAKQGLQRTTDFLNDLDDVTLGWNVDSSVSATYLDFELTAQSGTKTAEQFAQMKPGRTDFAGFLVPEAALSANWAGTLSDGDVAQAKENLATLRKSAVKNLAEQDLSAEEVKLATQLIGDVFDVMEKTVDAKKKDGGVAILLDPAAVTVIAGMAVVDGPKLEKVLKQLVDELQKSEPEQAKLFKLNADSYQGVRFHTFSMPTPREDMKPFVGDTLEVVLGIADDKVMLAAGRDAAAKLKKAIDQSKAAAGKEVPPFQVSLAVKSIAKFFAAVGDNEQSKMQAGMLAGLLEQAGDKDHVQITAMPIARGVRVRLQLEEGLLKALCSLGKAFGGMPPGGGPPGMMPGGPGGPMPPPPPPPPPPPTK